MRLLLDTHALLWWREGSPRLSRRARTEIADPNNQVFVSIVTFWEIILKRGAGKIHFPDDFGEVTREEHFTLLAIDFPHLYVLERLPFLHRDPFDRMLIAQSLVEGIPLMTNDRAVIRYRAPIIW